MRRLLGPTLLLVGLASPAWAWDFDDVITNAQRAWPGRKAVVVVCNHHASSMALMDLGSATERVLSLMVVDPTSPRNIEKVLPNVFRKRWREPFVLRIPEKLGVPLP